MGLCSDVVFRQRSESSICRNNVASVYLAGIQPFLWPSLTTRPLATAWAKAREAAGASIRNAIRMSSRLTCSAFFEWAGTLDGPKIESPEIWTSVYLVEASEDEGLEKTLQRHFKEIFEEQLESWYTRKADWPTPRTFAIFQEWFDAEISDPVFDLSDDEPLEHDE